MVSLENEARNAKYFPFRIFCFLHDRATKFPCQINWGVRQLSRFHIAAKHFTRFLYCSLLIFFVSLARGWRLLLLLQGQLISSIFNAGKASEASVPSSPRWFFSHRSRKKSNWNGGNGGDRLVIDHPQWPLPRATFTCCCCWP